MKISTKGKYGLRAMIDIAIHSSDEYISLKSVAERQNISESYLEQLAGLLKKAKLLTSIRGAQGGYKISRNPKDITVGQILRCMEGSLAPVHCVIEDEEYECERSGFCVTRIIWKKISDSINDVVDSITLNDLVEDYKSKSDIIKEEGEYCNG